MAAAQLSRTVNETDKPKLNSLRDSGELEQNAVKVIFLWKRIRGTTHRWAARWQRTEGAAQGT